ncbi:MAG: hypothetical protein ACK56I_13590, partial [bacterium]
MHPALLVVDGGEQQQLGRGGGRSPARQRDGHLFGEKGRADQLHRQVIEGQQPIGIRRVEAGAEGKGEAAIGHGLAQGGDRPLPIAGEGRQGGGDQNRVFGNGNQHRI